MVKIQFGKEFAVTLYEFITHGGKSEATNWVFFVPNCR